MAKTDGPTSKIQMGKCSGLMADHIKAATTTVNNNR
jgi:hypothetical protein